MVDGGGCTVRRDQLALLCAWTYPKALRFRTEVPSFLGARFLYNGGEGAKLEQK